MRLSKSEAEKRAIQIAQDFASANGGANWACAGAKPDVLAPGYKRRKDVIKWSVLFDRSFGDTIVDGPAVVLVNIETGQARFF